MKRTARLFVLSLLLLVAALPTGARTPLPVRFTATLRPTPVHPGEAATVIVQARLDAGWHIYSVVPTQEGPAATEITSLGGWLPIGRTGEATPIRKHDPNFGREVGYHENAATFTRTFRVPEGSPSGDAPTSVRVRYQVCNASVCLPPTDATVPVTAVVKAGAVRPEYTPANSRAQAESATADRMPGGLGFFLLAAGGAGLLAIVTPCVFPLIPITLAGFVKQANGDRRKLARIASGYALGISALYVALGGLVSVTAGAAGINRMAANPWVNLVLFSVFLVFALSFFETVTLELPARMGSLQASARRRGGPAGLVLLGAAFVLASFTCTAPFVGTLLVATAGGETMRPLLGMLVFALAFASPFFVFALFPQWIDRIPKGGVWLARVKATLGFVELAAALKFLSNADMVFQWRLLTQPVLLAAWALIFAAAALYLLGLLRFGVVAQTETEQERRTIPPLRWAFIGTFLFAALYCFHGLSGRAISPYVGAFLPPPGYGIESAAPTAKHEGLPWLSDYEAARKQAQDEGKLLLIDFTGYTCTNCRLNEKNVFPHPDVQKEMSRYVRVQLYTDGGKDAAKNQGLQLDKFGDIALPLYGVLDPRDETVVRKTAGVQSVAGFARFLAEAPQVADAPAEAAWAPYSAEVVTQAQAAGKPVVIDFTADWCINCKAIEREVFEAPEVSPVLARDFVTLRADLTKWTSEESVALQKAYGITSLPAVVLLDRSGKEVKPLRVTGRIDKRDFVTRLETVSRPVEERVAATN